MTTLLERPTTGQPLAEDMDEEYLFYEGNVIVGRTSADCFICAWKEGQSRWPAANMAITIPHEPSDIHHPCVHGRGGYWLFYEQDLIVRWLNADCFYCVWREGHPAHPVAEVAMPIDLEPGDVDQECRVELKRRRRAENG